MQENIYIIGAGAIGKTLAVLLKLAKRNVTIIRGSVTDLPGHHETIQVVIKDLTLEADVEISTLSNFQELNGVVILANKSFGNSDLAISLKDKINQSPIVLLQNGLGVEAPFENDHFSEIYRCVLFVTGQSAGQERITFKPVSVCPIGVIKGDGKNLQEIVELLSSPHFQFRAEPDIQPIIWKKAIVNSVFNSVCPLLDVDNGVFHREKEAFTLAKRLISECVPIAKAEGIVLSEEEVLQSLLQISEFSDGQLISTLQDINNNRKTEIETLNFEIVRIAKRLGMEHLVKETALLGELVKLKSELTRQ